MTARFRDGTLARIDAVLRRAPREYRTDFIAEAVEKLLAERENELGIAAPAAEADKAPASAPPGSNDVPTWDWLVQPDCGEDQADG